ncbi:MAG: ATP-binding cassette domain-containing protein [Anaerolineae bacterium]|nr:ATP-binding cassette domain-containing protein [Anaerolineae bacterium]
MSEIVLRVEKLTKRYGSLVAVNNLSMEVREGEVFGFLGPNGAGKTTSISMMCGLLQPDSGRVLVHGAPIAGGSADVRARVGVCPQEVTLWGKLTCIEQLVFIGQMYGVAGRIARERGERLLEELDLIEKRNKQAHTLSGGMKRRLNLAMALVHNPDIVVLDEAEAGLDPQSRVRVREYIQSLARSKTVILTTHNMDEAERIADRVAIIDHGRLLVVDTPEVLKNSIGQGDVVEIVLGEGIERTRCSASLQERLGEQTTVTAANGTLTIHARDAVNLLPAIIEELNRAGLKPAGVHLRESTLEDVFIHLTGRRLRE